MQAASGQSLINKDALSYPEASQPDLRLSDSRTRNFELVRPNLLVRSAFYFSLFAIPFLRLYVPGTGERLGVQRLSEVLMIAAMLSRPRVCLRFLPGSLLWFVVYCGVRILSGLLQAPEYSKIWWPSSLELLQFFIPWHGLSSMSCIIQNSP